MAEMKYENRWNAFGRKYHAFLGAIVPEYAVIPLILCPIWNILIYCGTMYLTQGRIHYDFTSALDLKIPFVSQWIFIYLGCFAFWIINYILIGREGKEKCYRFVTADLLSRLICGFFFVLIPTINERPMVMGTDLSAELVRFVYGLDQPVNLFPSIHCLVSWFCFIGIRGSKKIPKWYQVFSMIFAILVFASTQFTKQHYLIDIPAGLIVAELCFYIANHTEIYMIPKKIFDQCLMVIFEKRDRKLN